jgi:hypothetical protein
MSKSNENAPAYVPVYAAAGMIEANLVRAVLEAAGIPVVVYGESAATAYGLTVGEMGRVEIWVPRAQQAEASEILARLDAPPEDEGPPADDASDFYADV